MVNRLSLWVGVFSFMAVCIVENDPVLTRREGFEKMADAHAAERGRGGFRGRGRGGGPRGSFRGRGSSRGRGRGGRGRGRGRGHSQEPGGGARRALTAAAASKVWMMSALGPAGTPLAYSSG